MKPSTSHLYLQILKWRMVNQRALEEDRERMRLMAAEQPAPVCMNTLYAAMDDCSTAAGRIAAQFSTAKD